LVELAVSGGDLALQGGLFLWGLGGSLALVQINHQPHKLDHPVVVTSVGRIGEVDHAGRQLFQVRAFNLREGAPLVIVTVEPDGAHDL